MRALLLSAVVLSGCGLGLALDPGWREDKAAPSAQVTSPAPDEARLDVIVPPELWTARAWKVLRPADGEFPGCGATVASASSGNGNSYYYFTLTGSPDELKCAWDTLNGWK